MYIHEVAGLHCPKFTLNTSQLYNCVRVRCNYDQHVHLHVRGIFMPQGINESF